MFINIQTPNPTPILNSQLFQPNWYKTYSIYLQILKYGKDSKNYNWRMEKLLPELQIILRVSKILLKR